MNKDDAQKIVDAMKADPEMIGLLNADPDIPDTETAAAVGAGYALGTGELFPIPSGVFVGLSLIESPFLGRPEDIADIDTYRALYVCAAGRDALRPIMGHAQRRERLERERESAQGNPALYEVWLKRADELERETWAAFDLAAMEYSERFGNPSPPEVLDCLFCVLRDARAGLAQLPGKPGGTVKKNLSTPSGSQGYKRFARWILGCLPMMLRGKYRS